MFRLYHIAAVCLSLVCAFAEGRAQPPRVQSPPSVVVKKIGAADSRALSDAKAADAAPQDVSRYEGRTITAVNVAVEGATPDPALTSDLQRRLTVAPNAKFSLVRVRDSLQKLFDSGQVARARVEATPVGADGVSLRFVVRLQLRVSSVQVVIDNAGTNAPTSGTNPVISTDEMRSRLTMIEPGARVTESALRSNADAIQTYLRDRGFYRAEVTYATQPDPTGTRATVTFRVRPNEQARVSDFTINIPGFDRAKINDQLASKPGAVFTRDKLGKDVQTIRDALVAQNYLAPQIDEPKVTLDDAKNFVSISLNGKVGPKVDVSVTGYKLNDKRERDLLPVEREGNIDFSVIEEGRRRLANALQQDGYFFAEINASCAVAPPLSSENAPPPNMFPSANAQASTNGMTEDSCQLNPAELDNRSVRINYDVQTGRRFKLTDIRIEGTNKLTVADIEGSLRTKTANLLAFVPYFGGYGRGYTSADLLEQDRQIVEARMRDLGYRQARVEVRRGVALNGDNLIITFVVNEGALTRVAGVEVRGNQLFTAERLQRERCAAPPNQPPPSEQSANGLPNEPCIIVGAPYSFSVARGDRDRLVSFYARRGYSNTTVNLDTVELPSAATAPNNANASSNNSSNSAGGSTNAATSGASATANAPPPDRFVRLIYTVNEGDKAYINRIIINGLVRTKRDAVLKAIPLRSGELLRADLIDESERILYATDAFRQVIIRAEPATETATGFRQRDIVIDVEERPPHILDYGGGYSTDTGPLGIFELNNTNLFGKLEQGAIRTRISQLQQLIRLDFFDPRFRQYGANTDTRTRIFMPLTLSLQYQRDSSVTRFFRSTIDRGTFGIVQRLDEKGNPIDQFGNPAGNPTINRFTFTAETQRTLQQRTRSVIFLRYAYEDVRLFNIESLLIADILRPDRVVRLSRFGASFARDTRDRQLDATRGDFLTADYSFAASALGGNVTFNKFQTNYRRYLKLDFLSVGGRETVLAGSAQYGVATLPNARDRNGDGVIDVNDRLLPISERFLSGGASTLRGFGYEEAGPRVVVRPRGVFRNSNGDIVPISQFTVPIGGNALAVFNAELRVGVTKDIQIVPFYDGGNVFLSSGDIFRKQGRQVIDLSQQSPNDKFSFDAATVRPDFTHTVGLGIRFKTPFGPLAVDYGFLLNPTEYVLRQQGLPDSLIRIKRTQIHFRFGQAF